jgi:hypothetical protein
MKTWYVYFYKSDSSSEPIGRIYAESLDVAKINAAILKALPIDEFDKIFDVKIQKMELSNENNIQ